MNWREITADEYDAIPGEEGGGMMGSVFKYRVVHPDYVRTYFEEVSTSAEGTEAATTPS